MYVTVTMLELWQLCADCLKLSASVNTAEYVCAVFPGET